MKRALFTAFSALLLAALAGCARERVASNGFGGPVALHGAHHDGGACEDAVPCGRYGMLNRGQGGCPRCGGSHHCAKAPDPGALSAPSAQITYPYYTLRGPRDFFQRGPSSIGP